PALRSLHDPLPARLRDPSAPASAPCATNSPATRLSACVRSRRARPRPISRDSAQGTKLALSSTMMNERSPLPLIALVLGLRCQSPDRGDPGPPQISVFVNATRVEVIAQQPGSCRALMDVRDADDCASMDWQYKGIGEYFEPPDCVPDPTCVDQVRLE